MLARDGIGDVRHLVTRSLAASVQPFSTTPDGQQAVFMEQNRATLNDIGVLTLGDQPTVKLLLESKFDEVQPDVSPNENWMAYQPVVKVPRSRDRHDRSCVLHSLLS